jgi:hypothetical protein
MTRTLSPEQLALNKAIRTQERLANAQAAAVAASAMASQNATVAARAFQVCHYHCNMRF